MATNIRLDVLLVERGLVASREKGKVHIKAGEVFVNGQCVDKAGAMFDGNVQIEIRGEKLKYVSRGGYKLEKILNTNEINLSGMVCMDVGASTGGFTDCMLIFGATKIYAVDVGTNQLDEKLRNDDRVISMENTNVRYMTPEDIGEQVDFVSMDVSFISVTKLLGAIKPIMKPGAKIGCLIKPQFEAGRENIGKGGIVKEPKVHKMVLENVMASFLENGFNILWADYSPIKGTDGNIEYLVLAENSAELEACSISASISIDQIVVKSHQM